jgi:hypothetical protein
MILGGWRTNWVLSLYSGQAQTINCSVASGAGTGCYALVVGDPYAGSHDVNQFYNPAAFADPRRSRRSADGLQPARRPAQPGHRPAAATTRHGLARQIRARGQTRFEVRARSVQPHEHCRRSTAGIVELPDARNFASITTMRNTPRQIQLGAKLYW